MVSASRQLADSADADLALPPVIIEEPAQAAKSAGLRYVSDDRPGLGRRRCGKGFTYLDRKGDRISDPDELERLKALVIPPAWEEVWICPYPNGHLLATGRDAKGRKVYRYHPDWREVRNKTKFDRLIPFGYARPLIREVTDRDLRQRNLTREKLLAIVVQLLEATVIRIGNDEYREQNQSFGLTTLQQEHVEVGSTTISFHFIGKSGVEHEIELSDRRLARAIKRCQELPGQQLFQYLDDDGERRTIDSDDVNRYIQTITGEDFTSKDFRTWAGTAYTAKILNELGEATSKTQAQANIREAIKGAAQHLGNRVATCRKFYVHPTVIKAYEEGWLLEVWQEAAQAPSDFDLTDDEKALIAVLGHPQQQ
ncbi:DNA topoisomerase IB [Nodosilinea sp. LEGE 06152]|uniref:DNA topoisomerase IB n=1 Tax=Nodosilinea sp. LEGE 06152 TaxID=2777966 RepID=UPI00188122F4|nr:DNA topoisomerase IB [Nodosilinea sp. LEGE 06152]MBE9156068.1 DNA topoisomerase IB [Nodosilinea sp. LEGE 06152]